MVDPIWEKLHQRGWGRWPITRMVEWAMRTYGDVPDRSTVRFVELGCGAGAQARFLNDEGFLYWGIDGSQTAVEAAATLLYPPACLVVGDVVTFQPAPDFRCDCVVDICTLQHLSADDAKTVIQRWRDILPVGGRFFSMWAGAVIPRKWEPERYNAPQVPEPRYLYGDQLEATFEGFEIKAGSEEIRTAHGARSRHWIIDATKR